MNKKYHGRKCGCHRRLGRQLMCHMFQYVSFETSLWRWVSASILFHPNCIPTGPQDLCDIERLHAQCWEVCGQCCHSRSGFRLHRKNGFQSVGILLSKNVASEQWFGTPTFPNYVAWILLPKMWFQSCTNAQVVCVLAFCSSVGCFFVMIKIGLVATKGTPEIPTFVGHPKGESEGAVVPQRPWLRKLHSKRYIDWYCWLLVSPQTKYVWHQDGNVNSNKNNKPQKHVPACPA